MTGRYDFVDSLFMFAEERCHLGPKPHFQCAARRRSVEVYLVWIPATPSNKGRLLADESSPLATEGGGGMLGFEAILALPGYE